MKNLYDESIMWGTHASVKNIDNKICQKVYEEYTMTTIKDHVIDEWVFNTIKSLDLESLVKLYDYVFNTIRGQITSYTMEYYEPFIEDILNIDTYYIIDSFIKIYRDVIILSENSILIGDMNFSNIIFGKNGIKVIDFDNYKINKVKDFTVKGYRGTVAESYAKKNSFNFVALDKTLQTPSISKLENTSPSRWNSTKT